MQTTIDDKALLKLKPNKINSFFRKLSSLFYYSLLHGWNYKRGLKSWILDQTRQDTECRTVKLSMNTCNQTDERRIKKKQITKGPVDNRKKRWQRKCKWKGERNRARERERERERENRVNEWNSIVNSESIEDIINPKRTDAHWYKSTARDDLY